MNYDEKTLILAYLKFEGIRYTEVRDAGLLMRVSKGMLNPDFAWGVYVDDILFYRFYDLIDYIREQGRVRV